MNGENVFLNDSKIIFAWWFKLKGKVFYNGVCFTGRVEWRSEWQTGEAVCFRIWCCGQQDPERVDRGFFIFYCGCWTLNVQYRCFQRLLVFLFMVPMRQCGQLRKLQSQATERRGEWPLGMTDHIHNEVLVQVKTSTTSLFSVDGTF